MAFSMSYDKAPQPVVKDGAKKAAKADVAVKPARTGRAGRANSPQAQAEALFEPKRTPDSTEPASEG